MSKIGRDALLIVQALVLGFGLLIVSGVIPEWGRWYSNSPHYTAQVNALLEGRLALSHNPSDLQFDLTWSQGGVHQVWGLGVPIWRLPFTLIGRCFGLITIPEHLLTGMALSCVAYLLLITFFAPVISGKSDLGQLLQAYFTVILLVGFPPFLHLLHSRFAVYEEAATHAYLYGLVEFCLVTRMAHHPTGKNWLLLAAASGFGPFIRPTLAFYGLAAWLVGSVLLLSNKENPLFVHNSYQSKIVVNVKTFMHSLLGKSRLETCFWKTSKYLQLAINCPAWCAGSLLFALGFLSLMLTNYLRFGGVFEFGHSLNLQGITASVYATRFENSFASSSTVDQLKELVGALFFPATHSTKLYGEQVFLWQSSALRLREMYFKAYDWTFLPLLLGSTGLLVRVYFCDWRHRRHASLIATVSAGCWALLSLLLLGTFYLRTPAITSRYLLDFAPAFAALVVLAANAAFVRLKANAGRSLITFGLLAWAAIELLDGKFEMSSGLVSLNAAEAVSRGERSHKPTNGSVIILPGHETDVPGKSQIPFDGAGWNPTDHSVMPLVIIFVKDPEFVELELAQSSSTNASADPRRVRVKIGLERLELASIEPQGNIWRLSFKGPRRTDYLHGIQPVFIALVPSEHVADEQTPWILRRVKWRNPLVFSK